MQSEKIVFVYFNKDGTDKLMGRLYIGNIRGKEIHSFEYDEEWLSDKKNNIFIDPEIHFFGGRQWKSQNDNNALFGIFVDSAPDRWGRLLLKRQEMLNAKRENRNIKTLMESDYLLGISDFTRLGAIRFKSELDGDFLASSDESIPPLARLRDLEAASIALEQDSEEDKYEILLSPGSSLGGARPKANVIDENGNIYIAKFPSKNDEYDVGALEKKVYDLAKMCGLKIVDSKLVSFSKYGSTFLVKRFDRDKVKRIHFESAMTLLGKNDGDDNTSYLDLASFIHSNGSKVKQNLHELFKRIAFNILVKNTDDHLRNHGFILENGSWVLSPLYDVNFNKDGQYLHLFVNENDSSLDTDILVDTAKYYELSKDDGSKIVKEMKQIIGERGII